MGNLRRYVYFHCCPKVHTRLFATFPGRPPNEFGELIRGDHGLDFKSIYVYLKSLKDHKAPPPPPPPEVLASSEEWLAEKLRKAQAPGELEQCLNLDELGHLRRSPVTVAIVCDYMQGVLQVAEEAIKEVMHYRGIGKPPPPTQTDDARATQREGRENLSTEHAVLWISLLLVSPTCRALSMTAPHSGICSLLSRSATLYL